MKLIRLVVACAVGLSLLVAGHAGAAAKVPCMLITDPAGDANGIDTNYFNPFPLPAGPPQKSPVSFPVEHAGPSTDAMDITSADIGADKKTVSVLIRLKKLAKTAPAAAPPGIRWSFGFTADSTEFTFAAHSDPTGRVFFDAAYQTPTTGTLYDGGVTGVFDLAKSEIHIIVPASLLAAQATIKPGLAVTAMKVVVSPEATLPDPSRKVAAGGTIFEDTLGNTDSAVSAKKYVVGARTCVTPGK